MKQVIRILSWGEIIIWIFFCINSLFPTTDLKISDFSSLSIFTGGIYSLIYHLSTLNIFFRISLIIFVPLIWVILCVKIHIKIKGISVLPFMMLGILLSAFSYYVFFRGSYVSNFWSIIIGVFSGIVSAFLRLNSISSFKHHQEVKQDHTKNYYHWTNDDKNEQNFSSNTENKTDSPYSILGVTEDAPKEVVEAAYRALSKKYHPDVNSELSAESVYKKIQKAHDKIIEKGSEKNS